MRSTASNAFASATTNRILFRKKSSRCHMYLWIIFIFSLVTVIQRASGFKSLGKTRYFLK